MKENNLFIRLAKILVAISAVMPMLIHGNDKSSLDISSYIYVLDIKINPKNTNELYAAFARSGLYRSTDKGETWIRSGAEIESFDNGVTQIAFDHTGKNVYVGTFRDLFMNYDGSNWVKLGEFDIVYEIFIQPTDQQNVIYVSTSRGLFINADGREWRIKGAPVELATFSSMFYPVAIDPSDHGMIYFALTNTCGLSIVNSEDNPVHNNECDRSGIYKSNDSGITLKNKILARSGVLLISSSDSTVMYGVDENIILKSIDGGASWKEIRNFGDRSSSKIDILVMNPADHNILYSKVTNIVKSGESQNFLFKSFDGGKTWHDISSNLPICNNRDCDVKNIVIDPLNTDILYIGTIRKGIFKSTDAGKSWKAINNGIEPSREN